MTRVLIILIFLFINSINSFCQSEKWDVYLASYEKGPGSTVLDMSYIDKAPIKGYPFLLITGVKFPDCNTDGLPVETAFEQLYMLSDKIKNVIDFNFKSKFVGTFTYHCERLDYYYLTDTIKLRERLNSVYETDFPKLKSIVKLKLDTNWDAYITFLYPNEETLEFMSNQKVILNLTNAGDNLTKSRKVDHWLYFNTSTDRDKFAAFAETNKYIIEGKMLNKDSKLPYQLQISRVDFVDLESITKITLELRKKAKGFNGDYDGWETFIIK